ncbi:hypothetical protein V1524DRAFT_479030 [Lipomyces starkeyi]
MWCRVRLFQPCRVLADETKPGHPRIEERLFPGCHYDLGRQRFSFLRTFAGSIAERIVNTLSWPVSREVKPNEVLSNLVLIWMLEKITNTLIENRLIFGNVEEKIRDPDTQIRNREVSTGSGDVYDQLLDYVPFGYIVDVLSLKGLPDRRIPDVGADVCDYENFYEQGCEDYADNSNQKQSIRASERKERSLSVRVMVPEEATTVRRSPMRPSITEVATQHRRGYPSKTYDIFKLLLARETDLDREEERARMGAEQRRLQQRERDERHIPELIRQTKHHRLADHDQMLPQNRDATAALVQKADPTEPQPSQMNQDRNQKQEPTPDVIDSNGEARAPEYETDCLLTAPSDVCHPYRPTDYGIIDSIGYFTGDDHGSNDKLCRFAAIALKDHEDIAIDENLAQQMKQKTKSKASGWRHFGGIGKIHNIAVDIRSSTRLYNEFKSIAGKALGLDNDTRWNSWYVLITTALEPKVRVALHQYLDRHYERLRDDFLTPEDWRALEDTACFLKPFYRATLESEGDFDSIDKTMMTMDILVAHYKRSAIATSLTVAGKI